MSVVSVGVPKIGCAFAVVLGGVDGGAVAVVLMCVLARCRRAITTTEPATSATAVTVAIATRVWRRWRCVRARRSTSGGPNDGSAKPAASSSRSRNRAIDRYLLVVIDQAGGAQVRDRLVRE